MEKEELYEVLRAFRGWLIEGWDPDLGEMIDDETIEEFAESYARGDIIP